MGIVDMRWLRKDYRSVLITTEKVGIKVYITNDGVLALTFMTEDAKTGGSAHTGGRPS